MISPALPKLCEQALTSEEASGHREEVFVGTADSCPMTRQIADEVPRLR